MPDPEVNLEPRTVLLYSGGLDSYALAALLRPTILLTVDTGTGYGDVEQARLRVPSGLGDRLRRLPMRDLARFERPGDLILPGRNATLVLAAANYGDTIYLGATAGDRVCDKDEGFRTRMNALLAHLYQPQWWLPEGRQVELQLPVKHLTKRQIVAEYLAAGLDGAALARGSFSCYHPARATECGKCKPCTRKWVALVVNGIRPALDCSAIVRQQVEAAAQGWDRGEQELADMREALELATFPTTKTTTQLGTK